MPRYTIHPWRTHTDLLTVRAQLYYLDTPAPDARRHAVDRILSCWKLRGNLPHAVESTALLIDAQLHHQSHNSERSDFALRAVYTAAFTRFVTGFCDIGRSREGLLQPSSMLDVAKRIGMPVHFVGLRHEAVHEELPSLGRLVRAVDEGLRWLWESSKDVASEAFALWLLHALELANAYAAHGSTDASLQAATLRVCCLYPGSWTKMVGQRLLEGDAELMADYQALFEASVLVANSETMEVDTEVGTAHDGGPSELPFSTRDELVAVRYSALHDHSTAAVGWRRALFAPSVPIGIVA
ncbi:rRNA-processing protein las1 [Rachicladosporium monterosium]|uniref:rRNA-processing protein las1 n=1 Tax=Rachicladosporium monterosium TaxID=1507873 RepID=A0ABR0LF85_9PEZI|nr:rRNA-processing protein las1 [Rachicladosporium monterosium]